MNTPLYHLAYSFRASHSSGSWLFARQHSIMQLAFSSLARVKSSLVNRHPSVSPQAAPPDAVSPAEAYEEPIDMHEGNSSTIFSQGKTQRLPPVVGRLLRNTEMILALQTNKISKSSKLGQFQYTENVVSRGLVKYKSYLGMHASEGQAGAVEIANVKLVKLDEFSYLRGREAGCMRAWQTAARIQF